MTLSAQLSIDALKGGNIHVVGLSGAEGIATVEFLWKHGITTITAHDYVRKEDFAKSFRLYHLGLSSLERKEKLDFVKYLELKTHFHDAYLQGIEEAEIIFASCGWFKHSANFPRLKTAHDKGVPFHNTIQLYLEYCTGTVIGVTGSNGKSTTSAWIAHILKHAGKTAYLAGNAREGQQVLDKIETMRKDEYLVLEISDRQMIESIPKSPHIAVITNISPNHLDDHGTLDQYITVKKRLFSHQNSNDIALVNWDNELTKSFLAEIPAKKYIFTENSTLPNAQEGCFIANSELLFTTEGNTISFGKTDELLLPGKHNQANAQAAATTCFFAGISTEAIKSGLQSFAGLPHRTKLVATTETGIRFYDDIQSTTPESTIAALQMFTEKIVLIAGGDDKGMTYGALSEAIIANVEQLIILPGSGSDVLFAELESRKGSTTGYPTITSVLSFAEALLVVNALAPHPDNVVISPACAGFQSHFLENKSITSWVSEMISLT